MLKYDEEYKSREFHVHNISPHYTKPSEGSRTEIQVMVKKEFYPNPKCFSSFSNSGWKQILQNKVNFMVKVYFIIFAFQIF